MDKLQQDIIKMGEMAIDRMNDILDSMNLTSAIKAQIDSGIKGDGTELRPTYMDDPFFKSAEDAQKWIRKYKKYQVNNYPEWNLPTRSVNTPNLNITGSLFFNYITADNNNGFVEIQAVGSPIEAELRAKYGDDLLSLSPQVKAVIFEKFANELQDVAQYFGFQWDADA